MRSSYHLFTSQDLTALYTSPCLWSSLKNFHVLLDKWVRLRLSPVSLTSWLGIIYEDITLWQLFLSALCCLALQSSQVCSSRNTVSRIRLQNLAKFSSQENSPDTVREFREDLGATGESVKNGTFAKRLGELVHRGRERIKAYKQKREIWIRGEAGRNTQKM